MLSDGDDGGYDIDLFNTCHCKNICFEFNHCPVTISSINGLNCHLINMNKRNISKVTIKENSTTNKRAMWNIDWPKIYTLVDIPTMQKFSSGKRKADVTADNVSKRWFIHPFLAENTFRKSAQKFRGGVIILPLSTTYRADRMSYREY